MSSSTGMQTQATLELPIAFAAIYAWEYITHLDHDFVLLKRSWPWNPTVITYTLCRQLLLCVSICLFLVSFKHYCTAVIPLYILSCLAVTCASALFAIRVAALWGNGLYIVAFAVVGILCQLGLSFYNVSQAHLDYHIDSSACIFTQTTTQNLAPVICSFSFDTIFCILMFFSLRRRQYSMTLTKPRILHILRNQGLLWVMCGTAGNIPAIILLASDFRHDVSVETIIPLVNAFACFILTVGATRMARALYVYNLDGHTLELGTTGQLFTSVEIPTVDHYVDNPAAGSKYTPRASSTAH